MLGLGGFVSLGYVVQGLGLCLPGLRRYMEQERAYRYMHMSHVTCHVAWSKNAPTCTCNMSCSMEEAPTCTCTCTCRKGGVTVTVTVTVTLTLTRAPWR